MHVFKDNYQSYIDKGLPVIPDKFKMKTPAIKDWSKYCTQMPTTLETNSWVDNFTDTNMALCLGEQSGIICLDFDSTDEKVIELLESILPSSPVGRIGAKGWARFFRYRGESTQALKYNGEMVIEILSTNKKITLPPSIHPNGMAYRWESETTLLDVEAKDLPYLPPMLFSHLESKLRANIPDVTLSKQGKLISGRNDGLSSLCGKLIQEGVDLNEALKQLLDYDQEHNSPVLFTDINEMQHTERFTNALKFYTNHLDSINTKRMRSNQTYEVPLTKHAIDGAMKDELLKKKEQKQDDQKRNKEALKIVQPLGLINDVQQHILDNSFIKQPALALSASLALMSTIIARKFTFLGNAPNLYLLNVAPSGAGKDAPQQCIKRILIDLKIDYLLGGGDYVSDASLMDSLGHQPVRLDLIDEASGLLKTVNKGGSDYSGKMADILCELYTTSNDKFMGRQTAEGRKGECYRPNVNLLMSTTPRGFEEGVTLQAIEKGLLGRTLIFRGDAEAKAERLRKFSPLEQRTTDHILYWTTYTSQSEEETTIGDVTQTVESLDAKADANELLDSIFLEFDSLRRETEHDSPELPIISRLFQQVCKLSMLHAFSRSRLEVPSIQRNDVEFAYSLVKWNFSQFQEVLDNHIHASENERFAKKILNLIRTYDNGMTHQELIKKTRALSKKKRQEIITDLVDEESIYVILDNRDDKQVTVYKENK